MRRPRLLPLAAIATVIALFEWLARHQRPRLLFDSSAYLEAAKKPWTIDQLFYPKPAFVPLVYRACGADPDVIVIVQHVLALASWTCLAVALVTFFRTRRARIAAGVVGALFVLAPVRIGYVDAILSESINDSLFALALAALLLLGRQRFAAGALVAIVVPWIFARDTNAIVVLAGAACAVALAWRTRRVYAVIAAPVLAALFALWSVDVVPDNAHFAVQPDWPADFTARGALSKLNNVFDRVLPDADARAYFADHGLPSVDELVKHDRADVIRQPELAASRIWIAERSRGVFLGYLARHPLDRVVDQVRYAPSLLGLDTQGFYMPPGWRGYRSTPVQWLCGLGVSWVLLIALGLACPYALWRCRCDPGARLALCLVVTGWIGSLAAFYGDSAEYGRHCYGSGQQIIFGLWFAALLLLERSGAPHDRADSC